jgi:hypothetical protein
LYSAAGCMLANADYKVRATVTSHQQYLNAQLMEGN